MGRARKTKHQIDWFRVGGAFLALWAFLNTYIDIQRYGVEQGFYWWFCNLALIGTAGGLLFHSRGWITGFLSIACFTQIFWVIDNLFRTLTHRNLFGMVEFMYQPGLPLDEFVLSHYHYYTIPISLIALFYLPQYKSRSLLLVAIFNPLIFGVSYFLFPAHQNVNCIHEPCFPDLEHWAGPLYSFLFWFVIFLAHLGICYQIEKYFRTTRLTLKSRRKTLHFFGGSLVAFTLLAVVDTDYKASLPRLRSEAPQEYKGVSVRYRYTLDDSPNVMLLAYDLENKNETSKVCNTFVSYGGKNTLLQREVTLLPNEKRQLRAPLAYPDHDVVISLKADCGEPGFRALTQDPSSAP
jgi:hypothetical protein